MNAGEVTMDGEGAATGRVRADFEPWSATVGVGWRFWGCGRGFRYGDPWLRADPDRRGTYGVSPVNCRPHGTCIQSRRL